MDYKLFIAPEVEMDITDGIDWYNSKSSGLGFDFGLEVYEAIEVIHHSPEIFQTRHDEFRICFLTRFPYGIHFSIDSDTVKVVMVIHGTRSPERWKEGEKRSK